MVDTSAQYSFQFTVISVIEERCGATMRRPSSILAGRLSGEDMPGQEVRS